MFNLYIDTIPERGWSYLSESSDDEESWPELLNAGNEVCLPISTLDLLPGQSFDDQMEVKEEEYRQLRTILDDLDLGHDEYDGEYVAPEYCCADWKEVMKEFHELKEMAQERLRCADKHTVGSLVLRMRLFDQYAWASGLFEQPPSLMKALRFEIGEAVHRDFIRPSATRMIAMGELRRVVIDGVAHFVRKEVNV